MRPKPEILFYCIPFLFLIIYAQVLFAEYAYLDEIYQLWHNNDKASFIMFHTQGRWLSGLLFQKSFSSISSIEQIKLLRLFSLIGWIITTLIWSRIYKKWTAWFNIPEQGWWMGSLYWVCSLSVCLYVGWASCMEVFFGILAGLLSGHILFQKLYKQQNGIHFFNIIVLSSFLGITSLFIYQPSFGIFLIPFFLYYIQRKKAKPDRVIITGIIFYLSLYLVYYFLFKLSLQVYHLEASNRTGIHFNFLKKLSFFFSGPFPQGFSMNLLFKASSIFSQVFYPLVFVAWLIITFKRNSRNAITGNILFVLCILFLLALIYLPLMIAAENFPSYRSLFAFDLAVFIMVTESLLYLFRNEKHRWIFAWFVAVWLIVGGVYAFNFQYINPLKKEYKDLRNFVQSHYTTAIKRVYFIRAEKLLFSPQFHTRIYRDEFGAPSTYRDWVPEPIIKQIVFEITKNRKMADSINVIQFESVDSFNREKPPMNANTLLVDMNRLFREDKEIPFRK